MSETLRETADRLAAEKSRLYDRLNELEEAIRDFVEQYDSDPETWPLSIAQEIAQFRAVLGLKD